jgi:hypothetical protein
VDCPITQGGTLRSRTGWSVVLSHELVIVDLDRVGRAFDAGEKELEILESLSAIVFAYCAISFGRHGVDVGCSGEMWVTGVRWRLLAVVRSMRKRYGRML